MAQVTNVNILSINVFNTRLLWLMVVLIIITMLNGSVGTLAYLPGKQCRLLSFLEKQEVFRRTNECLELIAGTPNLGLKTIRQMPAIFSHW